MKRFFAFLFILAVCAMSFAGPAGSVAYVWSKEPAAVTAADIGQLTRPAGTRFTLPVLAFGGVTTKSNRPIGGVAVVIRGKLAQEVTASAGVAVVLSGRKPVNLGLFLGFTYRL